MNRTNLPDGTGEALSVEDGANAITDLLEDDPATDLAEEDQDQEAAPEAEADQDQDTDPETEAEEGEDAAGETEVEEEKDGPEGYESGRFAADDAKVRLKDGSVISVQDLKRGYLSQQSFTRGTQENAKEREALASRKAEVDQTAQALKQERDFLLQVAQQFIPQPPDRSLIDQNSANYDPIKFAALKADYDDRIGVLSQLQAAARAQQERASQEQQQKLKELRESEAQKLREAMPELTKPEVYNKFWAESVETMAEYGFSKEEMAEAVDHRFYKIFRDLAAYRRARKTLPNVKQNMQSKPVMTGAKRMDPKAKSSREKQARQEHLRKTGTFEAGVSALMDLDL